MVFFEVFTAVFDIHFMEQYWTFKCTTYIGYQKCVGVLVCSSMQCVAERTRPADQRSLPGAVHRTRRHHGASQHRTPWRLLPGVLVQLRHGWGPLDPIHRGAHATDRADRRAQLGLDPSTAEPPIDLAGGRPHRLGPDA